MAACTKRWARQRCCWGPLLQTWALAEAQGRPPRYGRGRDGLWMSPPEPQDLRGNVSVGVTSGDDAGSWLPPASL